MRLNLKEKIWWRSPFFTFFLEKWRHVVREWQEGLFPLVGISTTKLR